jgi:integrase
MPKKIQPLTELKVRGAKTRDKEYKLSDGLGLHLLVTPSGGKLWRLQYLFAGKQKLLSFGAYPAVSLADARRRRDGAKELLATDIDPGEDKKAKAAAVAADARNTFKVVAEDWYAERQKDWSVNSAVHMRRWLDYRIYPVIGDRAITSIETNELVQILQAVASDSLETGHRVKTIFHQVFRYATFKGLLKFNPATDFRGAIKPKNPKGRAAPIEPKDAAPLLRAIDSFNGSFVVQCALKLAPLLFCRPGELRHMEWSEVDFEAAIWSIPGDKMKMGLPHLVPLSTQALSILKDLHLLTGTGRYAFPSARSFVRCMSDNAINAALRRMGFEKDEIVGHGFRAMARTMIREQLHVEAEYIEIQLAHKTRAPNGTAYDRVAFLPERRQMMQAWSDYLDELKAGAKVIRFQAKMP